MKVYCLLVFTFLTTSLAFSQKVDAVTVSYLKIKSGEEVTTYQFDSIEDFESNSEKILSDWDENEEKSKKKKDENLIIEISVSQSYGTTSKTVSGVINTAPSEILNQVRKLRSQLLSIVLEKP